MTMNRRQFMASAAVCSAALALPKAAWAADAQFNPEPGAWRTLRITTRIEMPKATGSTQAWVPLPSLREDAWANPAGDKWSGNAKSAEIITDPTHGARLLNARFAEGEAAPVVEIQSEFKTRDRAVKLSGAGEAARPLIDDERRLYLAATELMPTDGIVKDTAAKITAGKTSDLEKAKAIYEWVVDNTRRVASTPGCGTGDVASMLRSGDLGGKCADLNALYVALARASGVPARDVYGIRVAPSKFGYKSLGAGSEIVTKSQHCRAEVYLSGHGWVPVDPADVRKVVLEEPPGNNAVDSPLVMAVREKLFGAWEGNWLAYNTAHDLVLPGSSHKVAFLMYPQAEVGGKLLDCLDPDTFRYSITAAEVKA